MGESQRLNLELLNLAGREDIPALQGGHHWMGKAWGGFDPVDSPAVQHIIAAALAMPAGERLTIAIQGAMTNIASAISLRPDLIDRLEVYLMGFRYDSSSGIWNKNEFNIRNDLNAADFLLNAEGLPLHIMPADTCCHLVFDRDETFSRLDSFLPLQGMLIKRWQDYAPQSREWIMWDLALIEAIIHPHFATEQTARTPVENTQRDIKVYTAIDAQKMKERFFETMPSGCPARI